MSSRHIKDFIGVFPHAIPSDLCDHMVAQFDHAHANGFTAKRGSEAADTTKNIADDTILYSYEMPMRASVDGGRVAEFMGRVWGCYEVYKDEFSASFSSSAEHFAYMMKVQKTEVGQGYHAWHFEAAARAGADRVLAWAAYLNDVDEGGETEFLYQSRRVKPEKGSVCIFPAGFTHAHRGNPPLSNTKYMATGWYEY